MVESISIAGLSANDPVPGIYLELNFAAGSASAGAGERAALLIGNKLSSGSATADSIVYGPDTQIQPATEEDAIALFGEGSELHEGWRSFTSVNPFAKVYAVACAEADGYAAEADITLATNANGTASFELRIGRELLEVTVLSGDTPASVATSMAAQVNSRGYLPVSASVVGAVLTLTAKQKGVRGNLIRIYSRFTKSVAMTTSLTSWSTLADGVGNDSLTNVLATILPTRFYYIVAAQTQTSALQALSSQVSTQALALNDIRQRFVWGSVDSVATAITQSQAVNSARGEVGLVVSGEKRPFEIACHNTAVFMLEEAPLKPRCNFSGYGNDSSSSVNWKLQAPLSGAKLTRNQVKAALNGGVSPVGVNLNGSTYLVKRVTCRSLNGSNPDYRVRDGHKVTVADLFVDTFANLCRERFAGKEIGDDPIGNQPLPAPSVVTPRVLRSAADEVVDQFAALGLLQNADQIKANMVCIREASPRTRLSIQINLQVVDILDQIAAQINQVA
jgi:phage tail sheath gpL-like